VKNAFLPSFAGEEIRKVSAYERRASGNDLPVVVAGERALLHR